jgi:hypothetical protein
MVDRCRPHVRRLRDIRSIGTDSYVYDAVGRLVQSELIGTRSNFVMTLSATACLAHKGRGVANTAASMPVPTTCGGSGNVVGSGDTGIPTTPDRPVPCAIHRIHCKTFIIGRVEVPCTGGGEKPCPP